MTRDLWDEAWEWRAETVEESKSALVRAVVVLGRCIVVRMGCLVIMECLGSVLAATVLS